MLKNIKYILFCVISLSIYVCCSGKYVGSTYDFQPTAEAPNFDVSHYQFWGTTGLNLAVINDSVRIWYTCDKCPILKHGVQTANNSYLGDIVLEINGKSVLGIEKDDLEKIAKGNVGSPVSIKIKGEKGDVGNVSYKYGITNGMKWIETPINTIEILTAQYKQTIAIEKENYESNWAKFQGCLASCFPGGYGYTRAPQTVSKVGDIDTVHKEIALANKLFLVGVKGSKKKKLSTNSKGILRISLSDFFDNTPENRDMILMIERHGVSHDTATVVVPAQYITYVRKEENSARNLLSTAWVSYYDGKYDDAIKYCKEVKGKYRYTSAYEESKELQIKAYNASIKSTLNKVKGLNLTEFLSDRDFSPYEIAYVKSGIANMQPENGAIFIVEGLGMQMDAFEAIAEFRKMTLAQKLYTILLTTEKFAKATAGDNASAYLLVKEECLYEWIPIPRSVISKVTLLLSSEFR